MNWRSMSFEERFWSRVDKGAPPPVHASGLGNCWAWTGYKHKFGYGMISRDGRHAMLTTHRVSWEMHNGAIPPKMVVMHRCDNPACVNPEHLAVGTQGDNMRDAREKGRTSKPPALRGETNGRAKLTWEAVETIRARRRAGQSYSELGRAFGVSKEVARNAALGITWRAQ